MEKVKELLDYSKTKQNVSWEEYVNRLITILIKEHGLEPYIKFLGFKKKSKLSIWDIYSISAYDMTNDGIYVFKYDYNKVLEENMAKYEVAEEEKNKYGYYLITQAMLHEIEHAKHKKMVKEVKNNREIENIIVYLTLRHLYQRYPETFSKEMIEEYQDKIELAQYAFYNYSPTERLAEIHSYNNIENIIEEESIKKIFQNEKENRIIRGYKEDICSPTIYFFKQLDRNDSMKTGSSFKNYKSYLSCLRELSFYDDDNDLMISKAVKDYSLDDRLMYGFPITNNEYESLTKKRP